MEIDTPTTDEETSVDLDLQKFKMLVSIITEKLKQHGCLETYRIWC